MSEITYHAGTDAAVAALYGRHSHPHNRPLTPQGVTLVAGTLSSHLDLLGLPTSALSAMEVLECGGTGRDALAWLHLGARRVTHVDISEDNVARLRDYALDNGIAGLQVIHGDLLALDLPEAGFDVVRSRGVVHHLADPALALARYVGWLRPGGWLHFNVYRAGTFYYYGVQWLRRMTPRSLLERMEQRALGLGVDAARIGILMDDLFVPLQHPASPEKLDHDLGRLPVEVLWPRRNFSEVDHGLRYPDQPAKTEHLQWWCRRLEGAPPDPAELRYHQGEDCIAQARGLPEAAVSLAALQELEQTLASAPEEVVMDALIALYMTHHFEISTVEMTSGERHTRLAEAARRRTAIAAT